MGFEAVAIAVENRLKAGWNGPTVLYGNQGFPDGAKPTPDASNPAASAWCRFVVAPGRVDQLTHGGSRGGMALGTFQVFVPAGIGLGLAYEYADDFAALFRGVTDLSGAVHYISADGEGPGVSATQELGDGWFQVNVTVPIRYFEEAA